MEKPVVPTAFNVMAQKIAGRGVAFNIHKDGRSPREWKLLNEVGSIINHEDKFYKISSIGKFALCTNDISIHCSLLQAKTLLELELQEEIDKLKKALAKKNKETLILQEELEILESELG